MPSSNYPYSARIVKSLAFAAYNVVCVDADVGVSKWFLLVWSFWRWSYRLSYTSEAIR